MTDTTARLGILPVIFVSIEAPAVAYSTSNTWPLVGRQKGSSSLKCANLVGSGSALNPIAQAGEPVQSTAKQREFISLTATQELHTPLLQIPFGKPREISLQAYKVDRHPISLT